jgi:UDP-glucose 4-epimerase
VSLLELVSALEAVVGRPLALEHTQQRPGDVAHSQADQGLLATLFPDITPVPLAEGLRLVTEWFRSRPTEQE